MEEKVLIKKCLPNFAFFRKRIFFGKFRIFLFLMTATPGRRKSCECNDTDRQKPYHSENTLSQYSFFNHKIHINLARLESGLSRWTIGHNGVSHDTELKDKTGNVRKTTY